MRNLAELFDYLSTHPAEIRHELDEVHGKIHILMNDDDSLLCNLGHLAHVGFEQFMDDLREAHKDRPQAMTKEEIDKLARAAQRKYRVRKS